MLVGAGCGLRKDGLMEDEVDGDDGYLALYRMFLRRRPWKWLERAARPRPLILSLLKEPV